jgi:hypothetical protein
MATGLCPRCGGTDIYFAKRQEIKGPGGAWGVRARMVDTPLCKACGEVANLDKSSENREESRKKHWEKNKKYFYVYLVFLVGIIAYYFYAG